MSDKSAKNEDTGHYLQLALGEAHFHICISLQENSYQPLGQTPKTDDRVYPHLDRVLVFRPCCPQISCFLEGIEYVSTGLLKARKMVLLAVLLTLLEPVGRCYKEMKMRRGCTKEEELA